MTDENIVKSKYADITPVTDKTIPEFIWDRMNSQPHWKHEECLICGITEKSYTYQNIHDMSKGFGAGLKKTLGLKDMDVVTILLPNCPEFVIAYLGIIDIGCVPSLMNPSFKIEELEPLSKIVNMKCVITNKDLLPTVMNLKDKLSNLEHIILVDGNNDGFINFQELTETDSSDVSFLKGKDIDTKERIACIPFSSGTTGLPKGVMLTHQGICTNLLQHACGNGAFQKEQFTLHQRQERMLAFLPFFHASGLCLMMLNSLFTGAKIMILPKFEPKLFISSFKKFKPTWTFLVPPVANFIAESPELSSKDFDEMHTINLGGAPAGLTLTTRLKEKVGNHVNISEVYGMTELSPLSHVMPVSYDNTKFGSVGVLLPNTWVKIIELQNGKPIGPNQPGEMCIKGPQVMKGYLRNEVATSSIIDSEGYLHTGDLFTYDDDGFFYVQGRIKEIIKCKGFQVSPSELENTLRKHPQVADVAVIGVQMIQREVGEVPRAYIVRKDENLTENEIQEWFEERVVVYKRLQGGIQFVNEIPKNPSGKILRRELLQAYNKQHGSKN